MTSISMSGKLTLTNADAKGLQTAVMQGWLAMLNTTLQSRLADVVTRIREAVRECLLSSEEWSKIKPGGEYYGEFGLTDAAQRIAAIVATLVESIQVRLTPFRYTGKTIAGKVELYGIRTDLSEVLGTSEAVLISENGKAWQWLHALCFQGDEIAIADYKFLSKVVSEQAKETYSRTGEGFMVLREGSGWRVPPDISGTESGGNLITRALSSPTLQQTIENELGKLLS
jgi:hypothetical protein